MCLTKTGLGCLARACSHGRGWGGAVVFPQAVATPRDASGLTGECFIVEARVRNGPVKIPPCQCLPPERPIVPDSATALVVLLHSHDLCLVGEELQGLVEEFHTQARWPPLERSTPTIAISSSHLDGLGAPGTRPSLCLSPAPPSQQSPDLKFILLALGGVLLQGYRCWDRG